MDITEKIGSDPSWAWMKPTAVRGDFDKALKEATAWAWV